MGFKGYQNYQRNEIIKELNTNLTFSDSNSKFKKLTYSDFEFELNQSMLDSISRIKDSITTKFLTRTKEKIIFYALDKDTLIIKKKDALEFNYSSLLDKGIYDKKFNEVLVKSLEPFLLRNDIQEIQIYTLVPTEYDNIPPPPGTLANFDLEEEFRIFREKLEIDN